MPARNPKQGGRIIYDNVDDDADDGEDDNVADDEDDEIEDDE
jgi:hypothetical protein